MYVSFYTGGSDTLMTVNGYEIWVCICEHPCVEDSNVMYASHTTRTPLPVSLSASSQRDVKAAPHSSESSDASLRCSCNSPTPSTVGEPDAQPQPCSADAASLSAAHRIQRGVDAGQGARKAAGAVGAATQCARRRWRVWA